MSSSSGTSNANACAQRRINKPKNKIEVREDPDSGEPDPLTELNDAPNIGQGHDGGDDDGDMSMGDPYLLIETPKKPERSQDMRQLIDSPPVEDGPSIAAYDKPSTPPVASLSLKVAAGSTIPKEVSNVETGPHIDAVQSSLEGDCLVSGSFGTPQTRTPDTSFASENSDNTRSSRQQLSAPAPPSSSSHASDLSSSIPGITCTRRPVQMVLSTAGASWNLRHDADEDIGPPRKKSRTSSDLGVEDASNTKVAGRNKRSGARQNLRNRLSSYARRGSQVVNDDLQGEEDNESVPDEVDELEDDDDRPKTADMQGKKMASHTRRDDNVTDLHNGCDEIVRDDTASTVLTINDQRLPAEANHAIKSQSSEVVDLTGGYDDSEDISMLYADSSFAKNHSQGSSHSLLRPEIIRSPDGENISMRFDFSKVSDTWRRLQDKLSSMSLASENNSELSTCEPSLGADAGVSNIEDGKKAADALSRVIDKEDFSSMEITGQFNLAFIVARRRKIIGAAGGGEMDDLFIVDQHAADEKYNFETLQQTTRIKSQKLFRPQPLELTAADELLAIENLGVLQQNGFEVNVDDQTGSGLGHRLQLVAQPVSKSTNFDMKDLEELLHLMQDRPTGQMVRCSKVRAMFAMRACRKSVMVGMPLTKSQMTMVVHHMGTMDQPWNCPHGRPTMRHLSDIANIGWGTAKTLDWSAFGLMQ